MIFKDLEVVRTANTVKEQAKKRKWMEDVVRGHKALAGVEAIGLKAKIDQMSDAQVANDRVASEAWGALVTRVW
jgi:hypothetical protein